MSSYAMNTSAPTTFASTSFTFAGTEPELRTIDHNEDISSMLVGVGAGFDDHDVQHMPTTVELDTESDGIPSDASNTTRSSVKEHSDHSTQSGTSFQSTIAADYMEDIPLAIIPDDPAIGAFQLGLAERQQEYTDYLQSASQDYDQARANFEQDYLQPQLIDQLHGQPRYESSNDHADWALLDSLLAPRET